VGTGGSLTDILKELTEGLPPRWMGIHELNDTFPDPVLSRMCGPISHSSKEPEIVFHNPIVVVGMYMGQMQRFSVVLGPRVVFSLVVRISTAFTTTPRHLFHTTFQEAPHEVEGQPHIATTPTPHEPTGYPVILDNTGNELKHTQFEVKWMRLSVIA
jgi:hypothetical protein